MKTLIPFLLLLAPLVSGAAPPTSHRGSTGSQHPHSTAEAAQPSAALAEENRMLKSEFAALKDAKGAAEKTAESLNTELRRLSAELTAIRQASANVLQIQNERDNLQEKLIHLERELEAIKRAKQGLEEDDRQTWFLTGAGVLLAGMACGLIVPRLSWRRQNGWDSF